MKKKISDTFCVAPWFQVRNENIGDLRPCCVIDVSKSEFAGKKIFNIRNDDVEDYLNSDYSKYLRSNLSSGKKISECWNCWQTEKKGATSERQVLNNTLTKNQGNNIEATWIGNFLSTADLVKDHMVLSVDIKHSNLCNFSCMMCDPKDSTQLLHKWKKYQTNDLIQQLLPTKNYLQQVESIYRDDHNTKFLDRILEYRPRYLKILGGEPLIDPILMDRLTRLPDQDKSKMSIHFITNGSISIIDSVKKLGPYKNISFSVSLEGVGSLQDFIRAGSKWQEIEQNLLSARDEKIPIYIHHVLQAHSFPQLDKLLEWTKKHSFPVDFGVLKKPSHLSLDVLNDQTYHEIVDNLRKKFSGESWQNGENDQIDIEVIIALTQERVYDPDLVVKYTRYLDLHQKMNHLDTRLDQK